MYNLSNVIENHKRTPFSTTSLKTILQFQHLYSVLVYSKLSQVRELVTTSKNLSTLKQINRI